MLLAIDVGNTNTVFALCNDDGPLYEWRCKTDAQRTADEYFSWLYPLLQHAGIKIDQIADVIIGSVVPDVNFNLCSFCEKNINGQPLFVGKDLIDMEITLPNPEEVGPDRLLNAVAARERFGTPVVIVDFGTATTFDVVDAKGRYCGGVIAPGINLSIEALHKAAARLPRVDVARPDKVIGTGTVSAMQSGIYWGYVGLIKGILAGIFDEMDDMPKVVATGGLAPLFKNDVPQIEAVDKSLTLQGLLYINRIVREG